VNHSLRKVFHSFYLFFLFFFFAFNLHAEEKIIPEEEKLVPGDFEYDDYAMLLKKYVDDKGLVNYAGLKKEKKVLDAFILKLGKLNVERYKKWYDKSKYSLWLNAYNAFTLKVIVDHYPIQSSFINSFRYPKNSIGQIPNVWNDTFFPILGWSLTLHGVQGDVLRAQFGYPEMYFALNMGAVSSPPLRNEPYTGNKVDEQVKEQTKNFLKDPKSFRIDKQNNIVYISELFKWYGKDFTARYTDKGIHAKILMSVKGVLNYLKEFMSKEDKEYIEFADYKLVFLPFDWTLNEQPHNK